MSFYIRGKEGRIQEGEERWTEGMRAKGRMRREKQKKERKDECNKDTWKDRFKEKKDECRKKEEGRLVNKGQKR